MSGFTYLINLQITNGGAFNKLSSMAQGFETHLHDVQNGLGKVDNKLGGVGRSGQNAFGGISSSVKNLIAQIGIAAFTLSSLQTSAQATGMDNAIRFIGGKEGAANLDFVRQTAEDLKLPLQASMEGFKTLSGGMMGSGIAASAQRDIFKSVGEAALVMGLDSETAKGAFLALGQMASKGTVSAEELRGQLGERLPGAFQIAANAMGVTTQKLGKMMEAGEVASKDFLPKFAAELHKTFGAGVADALNGPQAGFNELNNSIYTLKNTIGTELMPTAIGMINDYLIPGAKWFGDHIDLIGGLVTVFGSLYLAAQGYAGIMAVVSLATTGFTGTFWGLNAAMLANPFTWIVGGFVALAATVYYAWNNSQKFRGAIIGLWESFMELGSIIYDYAIAPLMALGKTLIGVLTFDPSMIAEGIADGIKAVENIANSQSIGERMGSAFADGWNSQVKVDKLSNGLDLQDPLAVFGAGASSAGALSKSGLPGPVADKSATKSKAKKMADNITGGGQRNITINFNGKMIEQFIVNTTNVKEGINQMGDLVTRKLFEVINAPNQVQQ